MKTLEPTKHACRILNDRNDAKLDIYLLENDWRQNGARAREGDRVEAAARFHRIFT